MRKLIIYSTIAAVLMFVAYLLMSYFSNRIVPFTPSTVSAQGTVLIGGKPWAGVRVTYHPQFDIGAVKFTPNGTTDAQGKFTLSSAKPGDGAPPGEYIVTFAYPVLSSGGIEEEIDLFKGKYSDPAASQWKIEVKENSDEFFQLD
jgi:hypothetical protein